jgi:nucleoside-diphosphate-sugar epimerase
MIMSKHILIIGGTRFLGPYVVERLLAKGHRVSLFHAGKHACPTGVTCLHGDRNHGFGDIKEQFDVVVDMCAYTEKHIQDAVAQLSFRKFVFVSTAAVYKKNNDLLTEDSPLGDWSLWGEYNQGKVACEKALEASGVYHAIIRPVYILGAGNYLNREQYIYEHLVHQKPLVLPGDGKALVQFAFVQDTADAIALLVESDARGAYNCASDMQISLNDLVAEMANIVGVPAKMKYNPQADGDQFCEEEFPFANEQLVCSNEKLKNLGIAFTPLLDGLTADYHSYYKDQL